MRTKNKPVEFLSKRRCSPQEVKNTMVRKNTKYTPEWVKEIKQLIPKTEKVNGVDKSVIDKLIEERNEFDSEKKKLLTIKEQADDYEKEVFVLDDKLTKTHPKWIKFYDTATTGWNDGTNSDGWKPGIKTWVEGIQDSNNLYKGKILKDTLGVTADTDYEITEEEAIALLSRAIKAFGGINATDFDNKKGGANRAGITSAKAKEYLDRIQNQAKYMAKNKSFGREGYDLGYTYTGYDDTAKKTLETPLFNHRIKWANVRDLAKFIDDGNWADPDKLDHTNFGTEVNWNIYLKGDQYTSDELKNFVGDIANTVKYYKTGFKKTDNTWKTTNLVTVKAKTIKDWAKLILSLDNATAWTKLDDSQPAANDNIYQKLFNDMRDRNTFTETNGFSIDYIDRDKTKLKKKMLIQKASSLSVEYDSKRDKVDRDKTAKENEIQVLITEKIKELRTSLTTYKITDGFEDKTKATPAGADNRRTYTDLIKIKTILENIRFLEKDDDSQNSTESDENTAYTALETLVSDYQNSKLALFSLTEGVTNADKCKNIKGSSDDLQAYHDEYETWKGKIKFTSSQEQELKDIDIALGKQEDPAEDLTTYQTALKALDPVLTETVITQAIVDDWRTQNNFKTTETMKKELGKVLENKALNADFKKVMEKAGSEITDLGILLTKKKAKEVITMIRRWEYDKSTDTDKRKKLVWTLELKDPKDDKKYLDDKDLTDEEINKVLYEIAVGKKTLASQKKVDETNDSPNKTPTDEKGHLAKNWGWYVGAVVLAAGIAAVIYFWDKIKTLWEPKEEGENSDDE